MRADFGTRLLHSGFDRDITTGGSSTPVVFSSTFNVIDINEPQSWYYSRMDNPTRNIVEKVIASLENGNHGYAFSSGMAAINTALSLFKCGDHVIVSTDIYGGTYSILSQFFMNNGIDVSFVDTSNLFEIEEKIVNNTKGIFIETPSNPLLKITDLSGITKLAKKHGLITIADNTFMTPYLQNPLDLGIDVVIHSATKFLGGHSDLIAGVIVVNDSLFAEKISCMRMIMGNILSPFDSWLLLRGLKTLKVRMDLSQKNAMKIAEYFHKNSKIKKVYYPNLKCHLGNELHKKQARGAGAVISFDLGSEIMVQKFLKKIKYPLVAVSLGGVESILSYPRIMSHSSFSEEERLKRGISPGLLRLSVGLESIDDLMEDFEHALNC